MLAADVLDEEDILAIRDIPFGEIPAAWSDMLDMDPSGKVARDLCRHDRYFLLTQALKRYDALHPWLHARCREVEANPDDYLDLWSREHYKSTIITFAGVIQEILKNPEITIGIFSFNKPTARKFLRQIKYELETNAFLKGLFPEILWSDPKKEAPRWSEDGGIVVKREGNPKEATVEGHGLVDGQPTGAHFLLRVYDDVVTLESVSSPEMVKKTTEAWSLSDNLGARGPDGKARSQHVGTRYCTVASTKILMSDWSHKRIEDVRTGDEVVGWELRDGKRWLRRSTVKATGMHKNQEVNTYRLENGRSVTCTPDHRWWRGARGSGDEYQTLTVPAEHNRRKDGVVASGNPFRVPGQRRGMSFLCELLDPVEADKGRDAGWLAGMFDGEGTTKKNKNHPSGIPCIIQTMHNPEIIDELRAVLTRLGFEYTENWNLPISPDGYLRQDRCTFSINGGWRERYRFLAQINPTKQRALAPTLYGQLTTNKRKLVSVASAGQQDVFWLETETGNYVADGFCSKNSFRDTYQDMLDMLAVTPRIYPATDNGLPDGEPVFLTAEVWAEKRRKQISSVLAAQMLQNPAAGNEATFKQEWLRFIDIRPATLNVYIMCDPASSKKKGSDSTAIAVVGMDAGSNMWLLDGYCHKMGLSERYQAIRGLRKVWMAMPGVQRVAVGYERFGLTSDLEYFEMQMQRDKEVFEIQELAWPREGPGAKDDRIQRLEPNFRAGRFYMPAVVKTETAAQARLRASGQAFRIYSPVRRRDHNGNIYSLNKALLDQYLVHPFGKHDDMLDAVSRIYDMEPVPPILVDERLLEPEMYEDGI